MSLMMMRYAFLVHEIIEQMLSVKAGAKIYNRLLAMCDEEITPIRIDSLSDDAIRSTGTSINKVLYIKSLTNSILLHQLNLQDLKTMNDADALKSLTKIKGIGTWTAKMYLIFVLNRQNILPYEDIAFLQSYKWAYKTIDVSKKSILKKCKEWNPYSSIAARFMYKALDMGFTKEEFHLYK